MGPRHAATRHNNRQAMVGSEGGAGHGGRKAMTTGSSEGVGTTREAGRAQQRPGFLVVLWRRRPERQWSTGATQLEGATVRVGTG